VLYELQGFLMIEIATRFSSAGGCVLHGFWKGLW